MWRRSDSFQMYTVGGEHMVVPSGVRGNGFNGIIRLNETGVYLWNLLEHEISREGLVHALTDQFEVTEEKAGRDVDAFLKRLASVGAAEETGR